MTTPVHAAAPDVASAQSRHADAPLPLRGDTFLGVCEAIGTDLGFNANFLRIPLAALILWDAKVAIGAYLGLGLVVALARWLYPVQPRTPRRSSEAAAVETAPTAEAEKAPKAEELLAA